MGWTELASSVGFGDIYPTSFLGIVFSIVYVPVAVIVGEQSGWEKRPAACAVIDATMFGSVIPFTARPQSRYAFIATGEGVDRGCGQRVWTEGVTRGCGQRVDRR